MNKIWTICLRMLRLWKRGSNALVKEFEVYLMDRRYIFLFHVFLVTFLKVLLHYILNFLHIQLRYITYWIFQNFFYY